jgi:hypothetical protein
MFKPTEFSHSTKLPDWLLNLCKNFKHTPKWEHSNFELTWTQQIKQIDLFLYGTNSPPKLKNIEESSQVPSIQKNTSKSKGSPKNAITVSPYRK